MRAACSVEVIGSAELGGHSCQESLFSSSTLSLSSLVPCSSLSCFFSALLMHCLTPAPMAHFVNSPSSGTRTEGLLYLFPILRDPVLCCQGYYREIHFLMYFVLFVLPSFKQYVNPVSVTYVGLIMARIQCDHQFGKG